jgi:hypothetical protein
VSGVQPSPAKYKSFFSFWQLTARGEVKIGVIGKHNPVLVSQTTGSAASHSSKQAASKQAKA